jgi:hypothetical protein
VARRAGYGYRQQSLKLHAIIALYVLISQTLSKSRECEESQAVKVKHWGKVTQKCSDDSIHFYQVLVREVLQNT